MDHMGLPSKIYRFSGCYVPCLYRMGVCIARPSYLEYQFTTWRIFLTTERWLTALAISCGLDALTTGMIAGRLIYHHRKQKKQAGRTSTTIYLPIITIFIESAALSLISKILQLSVTYLDGTPIVVPLCTLSSNLIVLRKALGADVSQVLTKEKQDLSAPRFHRQEVRSTTGSVPGGFGSHLIETIGGHIIDLGPFDVAETLVSPEELAQAKPNCNTTIGFTYIFGGLEIRIRRTGEDITRSIACSDADHTHIQERRIHPTGFPEVRLEKDP